MALNTPVKLPENVAFHTLGRGGQSVIVSLDTGYLYTCNQTTHAFLAAVDGQRTLEQIVELLEQHFDVEHDRLSRDMLALAGHLAAEGLLVVEGDAVTA